MQPGDSKSRTGAGEAASPVDLSLVIACYNEEPHLEDNVRQILAVLDQCRFASELIFIDDCSRDRTRDIIRKRSKASRAAAGPRRIVKLIR